MELEEFAPLEPGTYFIDPDLDPSTPLRVTYEVPSEGWSQWIGAVKFADDGHVAVSITTVTNVVTQGCTDQSLADPPVGPSVEDLTTALANLAPFRVTSPPEGVTIYGYSGKHLELTVPDLPVSGGEFTGCINGNVVSWVAAFRAAEEGEPFNGYNGEPGRTEEFWILDVDGTRLMIEATWSPASPPEDVAELQAVLDSIRIEPSPGTTEGGQPAAEPYSILEGEVTLSAASPWEWSCCFGPWHLDLDTNPDERVYVLADPRPVQTGCRKGPAPANAEALALRIRSDPDLEATAPVAASVGGIGALAMDVVTAPGASVFDVWDAPLVVTRTGTEQIWASVDLEEGQRTRLYLLDLPDGLSARTLAIAIVAPEPRFEAVMEAAAPIVDSFGFHAG